MTWDSIHYGVWLARQVPRRALLVLCVMILVSVGEGLGLLLLVRGLGLVGLDVDQGSLGFLGGAVRSAFQTVGIPLSLLSVLGVYAGVAMAQALLERWQVMEIFSIEQNLVRGLRERFYQAVTDAEWVYFVRQNSAEFLHVLTDEIERAGEAAYFLFSMVTAVFVAAVSFLLVWRLSPMIGAASLLSAAGLRWVLGGKTGAAHQAGEKLSKATAVWYAEVKNHIEGMRFWKSHGLGPSGIDAFFTASTGVRQAELAAAAAMADSRFWLDVGAAAALVGICYAAIQWAGLSAAGTIFLLFLFMRLMARFSSLERDCQEFSHRLPSWRRTLSFHEKFGSAAELQQPSCGKIGLEKAVIFEEVTFRYPDKTSDDVAVSNANLAIPMGEITVIAGPSGAGKTTLADIAAGLLAPQKGRVWVDGIPVSPENRQLWRSQVAYVLQETFFFHGTLLANLRRVKPDAAVEEIWRALRMAEVDDFVAQLPAKLDTVIGERGLCLSGGQKQRIAIARALLRQPSLLILDEATSHLDADHEIQIIQSLRLIKDRMAILVVTHGMSWMNFADRTYQMKRGCVRAVLESQEEPNAVGGSRIS